MFKTSILFTALLSAAALTSVSAAPVQTEGTGIGKHGDIKLAVTFDNGKIGQDIKVLERPRKQGLGRQGLHRSQRCCYRQQLR